MSIAPARPAIRTRPLRYLNRIVHILAGKDLWQRTQINRETVTLGEEGAQWSFFPGGLSETSVVYSLGVGEDISFDLGLISQFGVRVHAFDPTPRSVEWIAAQALPPEFVFHAWGIADYDGTCKFSPPVDPSHISHTILQRTDSGPQIEVPVLRLGTIMKNLGHTEIDLLKMDIEGAEYAVITDLLSSALPIKQLLVEFHHRWPEVGTAETKSAIRELNAAGLEIFNISPNGEEYSFLHTGNGGAD